MLYGNCFVVGLYKKIKSPRNIKVYFINPKNNPGGSFHVMWKNSDGKNYHFTTKKHLKGIKKVLFAGYIEEIKTGTIERYKGIRFL